ncbi:hypothetical protein F5888DRAFT_1793216 [Russula emetica]|nr:hypothetical protein F5888DRAFT_1793216 [Russula emetica]
MPASDSESDFITTDEWHTDDLLHAVFTGCATENSKVVTIALGSLQRLIALRAVTVSLSAVTQTMNDGMSQGVDIQLKILQTLLSLITDLPTIHGRLLANPSFCFKLHESRTAVASSTAAPTLRQLVMFVVEKVPESTTLPDGTRQDETERPQFLQLEYLHKTFSLELIESVLTNYHKLLRKLLLLLQHHLFPLLLKTLSERSAFPLPSSASQFSSELETEAEVILTLLIKLISGETDASEPRPGGGWGCSMEIMRGLCSDAEFMRSVWQRYDALATDGETGNASSARVFTLLISTLSRLMHGVGVPMSDSQSHLHGHHNLDRVAEMVVTVASATVSNVIGVISTDAGLSVQTAAMKVQCIDQLDKADAPLIPEAYIYLLGVQCIVSLSDGLAGHTFPFYNTLAVQKPPAGSSEPVRASGPLNPTTLPEAEPARARLRTVRAMLNAGWPALLADLSFLLTTKISDSIFGDVLGALQTLALAARCPTLPAPPGGGGGGAVPRPPGLSPRNLACLRALVADALFLAGTLGSSWFAVLEGL